MAIIAVLFVSALILAAADIYFAASLIKRIANRRAPVLIEDVTPEGTTWSVSLDGHNPAPDLCVACATREDALRLCAILEAA